MQKEILIYGLPKGETREYMEDLLACFPANAKAEENTARVLEAAGNDGWHSFRITSYNGEAPDFTKVLNI